MEIFSKDFCTYTSVYTGIYMSPCRRSYILLVQKCWTSEIMDKWSPISKLSIFKFSHYPYGRYIFFTCTRTRLSAIPIEPVFFIFSNLLLCLLWLNFEYWVTCRLFQFRCNSATAYVLQKFSNVLADWYFS